MSGATSGYKVRMDLYRSTWNWFTTNPQGGGFGSNHCGSKKVALASALRNIPAGSQVTLVVNGKVTEHTMEACGLMPGTR